ncbi:MAG: type VI secretion system tip protein TssI/VgrG [Polyangiaceae bacterium]
MADSEKSLHTLELAAEGIEPGIARVVRLSSREALSAPYCVDVDVVFPAADFDPRSLLHKPAAVAVVRAVDGVVLRRFGGIVTRTRERVSRAGKKLGIGLRIEPYLTTLRLTRDHRIFQEKDTKAIVSELLDEAGIGGPSVAFRLTGSYPTREVCTQFGETSFDFVSRILEEDGISYFHEQGEDGPVLVITDASSGYTKTTPEASLVFRGPTGLRSDTAVLELVDTGRVHPARVTLRDHDFKRPSLDLTGDAEMEAPLGRERYEYPGYYIDPAEGKRRAKAYLSSLHAAAVAVSGKSTVFSLAAGHTFDLSESPDPEWDRAWVVRDVEHVWEDTGGGQRYENRFHLLPDDTDFRPRRGTLRPVVPGPHVAHVTGPSGEEIHTDDHGRVKGAFPRDRYGPWDDKSSCWVRVGQLHSSGSVAIPRVGWEVLVVFEDAIRAGPRPRPPLQRAVRAAHQPPGKKTVSMLQSASSPGGGGYNEIVMEDSGGGEVFGLTAQKDMNVHVANKDREGHHDERSASDRTTMSPSARTRLSRWTRNTSSPWVAVRHGLSAPPERRR